VPKELFEIKDFEAGIVTNPDDRDIPPNAATYSENIDPYGQSGSLMGIHADATAKVASLDARRMVALDDDGGKRIVYVDNSDGDIKQTSDIYESSPSISTLQAGSFGAGEIAAMTVNNNEVHIGLGKTKDPKWVGFIPHGQFSGTAPSGLQIDDAQLKAPSPFPNMHKIVANSDNTFVYGAKQNDNYLYKFNVSTGKLEARSQYYFTKIKAIALEDNGNIWVADEVNSNLTIIKVDKDVMDIMSSRPITSFTDDTNITDIEQLGNTLWLVKGNHIDANIYNVSVGNLTTGSTSVPVVDRTPFKGLDDSANPTTGDWTIAGATGTAQVQFKTPRLPLVKLTGSNSYMGMLVRPTGENDNQYIRFHNSGTTNDFIGYNGSTNSASDVNGQVRWMLLVIKYDLTAQERLGDFSSDGTVLAFSSDFTQTYDKVFQAKQSSNSSYLNISLEGASSSVSTLYRLTKIAHDHTQSNIAGGGRTVIGTDIDIKKAVADDVSGSYNVFSNEGQVRWATGSSGSLVKELEGEVQLSTSVNSDLDGSFTGNDDVFYAVSFLYDGYQESPIANWTKISNSSITANKGLNVEIEIYINDLSKRVTHVNLYRSDATGSSNVPSSFFRYVESVSLKTGWEEVDSNTSNPDWGNYYRKTIADDGASYASYESRTGISEALFTTLPKYKLAARVNNFLYISNCSHPDIEDATNYLFKSRPFNFDQFNWIRDSLKLPNPATALESFNGRLYAFSENELYVINPDGMYIEDTIKGIGCKHQNAITTGELGMSWIDKNSIYYHNGQNIVDIAQPIKSANQIDDSYNEYMTMKLLTEEASDKYQGNIFVAYDTYRKAFCYFFTTKSGAGPITYRKSCLVFTVPKQRWDFWNRGTADYTSKEMHGHVIGKNNEIFISDSEDGLIQPFDPKSNTRRAVWEWYSKKFTMGDSTADKKFYKAEILSEDSTPTLTVNTTEDSSSYGALSKIAARHLQVRIANNDSTAIVDALRVVFRRLKRVKDMA